MKRRRCPPGPPRPPEAGYALLLALFVIFLVSLTLALLFASLQVRLRVLRDESRSVQLVAQTDAALAEALAGLALDPAFPGISTHSFGRGTLTSQVQRTAPTQYLVSARGTFAGKWREVAATVQRDASGLQVMSWRRTGEGFESGSGTASARPD